MTKKCKWCGAEFKPKRENHIFCSSKCSQAWAKRERIKKWREYACKKKHGGCDNCNETDCVME